ncbi:RecBCD enzyme subunit RecB [Usitatibacter rugosus]|uniref:DNA 3'-5' helicase n=1 Tax=Usitatibacter rugosus TaxID=2732067 RepID=A0A6M4GRS5_9PROT|nr:UvrD-helicase domain-containing protein [Usitatibacter rugosus]QJR09765.1 RecBCD enzyme subunit RecB [Usitatibacter rugosus]
MSGPDIVDAAERAKALDPERSLIVQAPAGSGKTGLLIQRYLRLLATVGKPEEVLAITFTRKAAAEMRRRVLEALQLARVGHAPREANQALTYKLASDVLARDSEQHWDILDNVARLRIQTIDSLSASLARQMPVLSRLGAPPAIIDDARELYREAAERTLALVDSADATAGDVARVLDHLDGEWATARDLLQSMLGKRDQWLKRVNDFHGDHNARESLEAGFRIERARILGSVHATFPRHLAAPLARLGRYASDNISRTNPDSLIARLVDMAGLPAPDEAGADSWCALAAMMLVKEARFRKTVDKGVGFPPEKGAGTFKEGMIELLGQLAEVPGLCKALDAVRRMPPATYSDEQWSALGAMVALLPIADQQLREVFAERGEMDFAGIAQHAVLALGTDEQPTDLLLALDTKIRHLLVDEFQDTSHAQWDLLHRLTGGWEPGDGRTVFLVGDPMQSIYRFREADVALFLRARTHGLPNVPLEDVRIRTNFRSRAGIVHWVNEHFPNILRGSEDPDAGAVEYSPSAAHHPGELLPAVTWHPFLGTDQAEAHKREADEVVRLVNEALALEPEGTIAILVRARTHLDWIVRKLRGAKVKFRAVDIEPLEGRQVIQDLLAVTRALSHPSDRVAWLGLLRAPWCAMRLSDLQALTGGEVTREGNRRTVWELMNDPARSAGLSHEGRQRMERVRSALQPFVVHRLRGTLRERVEAAWLALGGPACAFTAGDLDDAETFFDQLDKLEHAGELPDPGMLNEQLEKLYAAPDTGEDARVQIMTIHKAKGLEFGTVIVPGLDRVPRGSDRPLFAWKARASGSMLMAPIRPARDPGEPAYDYLRALEKSASQHELERLLYVAATRAEKRLHLMGYARLEVKDGRGVPRKAPATTLLGKAWSAAEPDFLRAVDRFMADPIPPAEEEKIRTELRTLDVSVLAVRVPQPACTAPPQPLDESRPIEYVWADPSARHIGTVAHGWLQRIAVEGLDRWDGKRVASLALRVSRELARLGVPNEGRDAAVARVLAAVQGAISHDRGRWILGPHPDAKCEYRIRVPAPGGVRTLVIDRLFTFEGRPWIVDYKTSSHEGGDLEAFLDSEKERYAGQMARYVPAFRGAPGSLGLYFPLVEGWREWEG